MKPTKNGRQTRSLFSDSDYDREQLLKERAKIVARLRTLETQQLAGFVQTAWLNQMQKDLATQWTKG